MLVNLHDLAEPFSHKREEGLWVDPATVAMLRVASVADGDDETIKIWGVEISRAFFIKCNDLESATAFAEKLVGVIDEAKLGHYKATAAVQQAGMKTWADEIKKW